MSLPSSPVSQLLRSLGITRSDLDQKSNEMRKFLSAEATFQAAALATPSATGSTATPATSTSTSQPTPSTPTAPVKRYDSMEEVMERKSRQSRKERKLKQQRRTRSAVPPSPTPSNASRRVEKEETTPSTRHLSKYYREHTLDSVPAPRTTSQYRRPVTPPPKKDRPASTPSQSDLYAQLAAFLTSQHTSQVAPVTPRRPTRSETIDLTTPLPPSSSPIFSPSSSPVKPIVNLVSSPPRPLPPPPAPNTSALPYILPPPPYSTEKPTKPYAALIGQAILASSQHRLTLQEIYDYMSTVYPYFKRRPDGGTETWMNSVRHVLSTTIVFRKCVRERRVGRSLWAIWDEDLDCFAGGNYKKKTKETYILSSPVKNESEPDERDHVTGRDDVDATPSKRPKRRTAGIPSSSSMPTLPTYLPILPHAYAVPMIYPAADQSRATQMQSYYSAAIARQHSQAYYHSMYAAPHITGPAITIPSDQELSSEETPFKEEEDTDQSKDVEQDQDPFSEPETDPLEFIHFDESPQPQPSSSASLSSSTTRSRSASSSSTPPTSMPPELDVSAIFDFDFDMDEECINESAAGCEVNEEDVACILDVLRHSQMTLGEERKGKLNTPPGALSKSFAFASKRKKTPSPASVLGPVKSWDITPGSSRLVFPSSKEKTPKLSRFDYGLANRSRSKADKEPSKPMLKSGFGSVPLPSSPTLNRKAKRVPPKTFVSTSEDDEEHVRMATPPPVAANRTPPFVNTKKRPADPDSDQEERGEEIVRPCTPPRKTTVQHPVSSLRTPLGPDNMDNKGKGKAASSDDEDDYLVIRAEDDDRLRTPKRRRITSGSGLMGAPVTPKRTINTEALFTPNSPYRTPRMSNKKSTTSNALSSVSSVFPSARITSPLRTPAAQLGTTPGRLFGLSGGGGFSSYDFAIPPSLSFSPFRTPGRTSFLDAHDQLAFFSEELSKIGVGEECSPVGGLFGKGSSSLLYQSPTPSVDVATSKRYW